MRTDPRIAYVRLKTFGEHSARELQEALAKLRAEGNLRAVVLDVRDNSGGYLKSATDICNLFIDEGEIVTTRRRDGSIEEAYFAGPRGTFLGFPMAVLINRQSASASEIVAACLQDHGRATLVGTRTWGKGSVQQMITLERGKSTLTLTTSSFWRPSGRNIHRLSDSSDDEEWGVQPDEDFLVPMDQEADRLRRETRQRLDRIHADNAAPEKAYSLEYDPQLRRAVEHLQQQLETPAGSAGA